MNTLEYLGIAPLDGIAENQSGQWELWMRWYDQPDAPTGPGNYLTPLKVGQLPRLHRAIERAMEIANDRHEPVFILTPSGRWWAWESTAARWIMRTKTTGGSDTYVYTDDGLKFYNGFNDHLFDEKRAYGL